MLTAKKQGATAGAGPTSTGEAVNGAAEGQTVTKVVAMREALAELGLDASNKDLEEYIRRRYGAETVPANLSVAKSVLRKKMQEEAAGNRAAPPAPVPVPVPVVAWPAAADAGGISIEDVRQVKELAERLGKDQLKEVVDLLA